MRVSSWLIKLVIVTIVGGLLPMLPASPTPPQQADAICDTSPTVGDNTASLIDCGVTSGYRPINSGGGSSGGGGPVCTSGLPPWKYPRPTGDYPQLPAKSASVSIVAEFEDRFWAEWARVLAAWNRAAASGTVAPWSFFWSGSIYDVAAIFAMIDERGRLDVTSGSVLDRTRLFDRTVKTTRDSAEARLVSVRIGPYGRLGLSDPSANVARVYGPSTLATASTLPSPNEIRDLVDRNAGAIVGEETVDLYEYLAPNGRDFTGAPSYVWSVLENSYVRTSDGRVYPYEILIKTPDDEYFRVASRTTLTLTMPAGTQWYVRAVFPNRRHWYDSLDELHQAWDNIIAAEMTKRWGQAGASNDRYGYWYPAFMAPSDPSAPNVCGSNAVTIKNFVIGPLTNWRPGSWNGCRTNNISSTSIYRSNITNPGACWLAWLRRPLNPPKLDGNTWEQAVIGSVSPVTFKPIQSAYLIGAPISLTANQLVPPATNKTATDPTLGTVALNLTPVGVTAEIGGQVKARAKAPPASRPTMTFTIDRTPLSRLQDEVCVQGSWVTTTTNRYDASRNTWIRNPAILNTACGIVYDRVAQVYLYRVVTRTWWDGMYQTRDGLIRPLFDPQWVKFQPPEEVSRTRPWDPAFAPASPIGRSGWPSFGPTYPMYAAHEDGVVDLLVVQSQPVGR